MSHASALVLSVSTALLAGGSAVAETIAVDPLAGAGFELDIDGDGVGEFTGMFGDPAGTQLGIGLTFDGLTESAEIGSQAFIGVTSARQPDLESLTELRGFADLFVAPSVVERSASLDNAGNSAFLFSGDPLLAQWTFGTSGSGTDPVRLIGWIVDARDYFSSGGDADIVIHYHDFGEVSAGDPDRWISLRETEIPLDGLAPLEAEVDFPGDRTVSFEVASESDALYRILRRHETGGWRVVESADGDGSPLTLEHDGVEDTGIFRLEKLGPDSFGG